MAFYCFIPIISKLKTTSIINTVFFLCLIFFTSSCKKEEDLLPEEIHFSGILSTLHIEHPRLLLTDEKLVELKELSKSDPVLNRYVSNVISQAEKDLVKVPIQHILIGPRLLDKSREALNRIYSLSFAYRWNGNPKYLNAAISNLKNVCGFPDWNPSHFLDVAEMTHAVAIGYDWLYNDMDQESSDYIREGLKKLGLEEGRKALTVSSYPYNWWKKVNHNWNQVCNSGLLIGALAVAESDSAYAFSMLPAAIENLPYALKSYGPDGAWGEGPGYWNYATDYTAFGISALQTALGNTFNLTLFDGMAETGYFPIYSAGPTGYMLNYADAGEKSKLGAPHAEMWLSQVYDNEQYSDFTIDQLNTRTADVFHVIWYRSHSSNQRIRDLDKYFGGDVALFFSRSSWTDPNALYMGVKAGYNRVNHAHLDLGNFEFDALGERWVRDLGSDDYNLPGYFSTGQTGARWTYYRLGSFSHNVPVLDNKNQDIYATSKFIRYSSGVTEPFAILDFTEAYKTSASMAKRGIKVIDSRKSIIVQDEFTLTKSCNVLCGITTDAAVLLINSQKALLTLNGKEVTAQILSPADAVFSIISAEQPSPQKPNTGVKRLLINKNATAGNLTIILMLSPQWGGVENIFMPSVTALSSW
jgi:hypothetical protein